MSRVSSSTRWREASASESRMSAAITTCCPPMVCGMNTERKVPYLSVYSSNSMLFCRKLRFRPSLGSYSSRWWPKEFSFSSFSPAPSAR
ncbi:hypothetical protein D3C86_2010770 [compost metagenome]